MNLRAISPAPSRFTQSAATARPRNTSDIPLRFAGAAGSKRERNWRRDRGGAPPAPGPAIPGKAAPPGAEYRLCKRGAGPMFWRAHATGPGTPRPAQALGHRRAARLRDPRELPRPDKPVGRGAAASEGVRPRLRRPGLPPERVRLDLHRPPDTHGTSGRPP